MDVLQPIAAVALVLGLLGLALFFLRKRGVASFQRGQRRIEVVERTILGPHHALHLVRIGGRSVVVATAPSSCQVICEMTAEEVRI